MSLPFWKSAVISICCACAVMLVHAILPSMVNGFPPSLNTEVSRLYSNEYDVLDSRYADHEFSRRPVILGLHSFLSKHMPEQAAFNVIQLTLLALFFFIIDIFFRNHFLTFCMTLSFPIVFAYMGSIYTYDDILQYILVILALVMMERRRFELCWLVVFTGSVVRETTVLLIPVVLLVQYAHSPTGKWKAFASAFAVMTGVLMFMYLSGSSESVAFNLTTRFEGWRRNFSNYGNISESIILPLLVIGWVGAICVKHRHKIAEVHPVWYRIVLPFTLVNIALVWIAAVGREARLYMLPMLFIVPLIAPYVKYDAFRVWQHMCTYKMQSFFYLLAACTLAWILYQPYTRGTGYVFQAYATVYFMFLGVYLFSVSVEDQHINV